MKSMFLKSHSFRDELKNTIRFAFPIVLAQVSFMLMGLVDTVMLGRIDTNSLASAGLARSIFWVIAVFAMGILSALDTITSQAYGAGNSKTLESILYQSLKFCFYLSIIFSPLILFISKNLWVFKSDPSLLENAEIYLAIIGTGLPFLLFFTGMQRYWQSRKVTKPILVMVLVANVINYFANRALIFGEFGFPSWGVYGAAVATNFSRGSLCLAMFMLTFNYFKTNRNFNLKKLLNPFSIDRTFAHNVLRLGIPAGWQQVFEVGIFSLTTVFAAWLNPYETAAHHVVIMIVSFTYMFPVGLSSAAAYRVGYFVGTGDREHAKQAGWISIIIGIFIMSIIAVVLFNFPEMILSWFTYDLNVIRMGSKIIFWGAVFQVFDAVQACATGALRGLGHTKTASVACAIGYYPIGLLLALILCFSFHLRLTGLWIGLCVGVISIAVMILCSWMKITHQLKMIKNKAIV